VLAAAGAAVVQVTPLLRRRSAAVDAAW
jgi:hypothetical protein